MHLFHSSTSSPIVPSLETPWSPGVPRVAAASTYTHKTFPCFLSFCIRTSSLYASDCCSNVSQHIMETTRTSQFARSCFASKQNCNSEPQPAIITWGKRHSWVHFQDSQRQRRAREKRQLSSAGFEYRKERACLFRIKTHYDSLTWGNPELEKSETI